MNVYPLKCRIRNDSGSGVTRVDVYDDIGGGGWFSDGLSAKDFADELSGVKGPLEVHINSGGGDVFDGIAIGNAVRGYKGPVTTVVDGLAASIASVIAQAGQDRVVQPGSMMMVHDASGSGYGVNAAEARKLAETLDKVSDNIASIYAEQAGGTPQSWRDIMQGETWYTADEAVAAGLADRIGDADAELPAGMDLAAFTALPGRIAARLRTMPQAAAAPHSPMTGTHSHPHPAYGSQGADATHDHEHSHDNDANHGHGHDSDSGGDADARARRRTRDADGGGDSGGEDDDGTVECPTCKGTGKIREGHVKCPDCKGTGRVPADDSDGAEDRAPGRVVAVQTRRRVLGIESMPLADEALPVHHTATVDETWDGPAAVAAMPGDDAVLRYCHAWEDAAAAAVRPEPGDDDADDQKTNYKFPHHKTKGGPANVNACQAILSNLAGGRTPADIPDGDKAGVKAHAQAHLDDAKGDDGTDDHTHTDLSAAGRAEQIRAALKGAHA